MIIRAGGSGYFLKDITNGQKIGGVKMKKIAFIPSVIALLLLLFLLTPVGLAQVSVFETRSVYAGTTNLLLVGDTARIQVEAMPFEFKFLDCEIQGKSVELTGKEIDHLSEGSSFTFKTVEPGQAIITLRFACTCAIKGFFPTVKHYTIRILRFEELSKVTLAQIKKSPRSYYKKLILLSGESRGWGLPVKTKEIWGGRPTKSDWVLEDETGAAYMTGKIVNDTGKMTVVAEVIPLAGTDDWAIRVNRIIY
jgi:hypothetical protein